METFIPCHEYVMWCEAGSKMPASGILFNVAVVTVIIALVYFFKNFSERA